MATKTIDVDLFTKMLLAGAQNIEAQKEYINELNVFPVPDGDTGTNMSLTIMSAVKEVNGLNHPSMNELAKAVSTGSLRGARGNSGVILSQLLRGFTKVLREEDEIDASVLAAALLRAKETAYKAVMKPKEGTILTVASGIADRADELAKETDDLEVIFPEIVSCSEEILKKTPDLLPVLKEAGVVDSGGQGLVEILKGAYDAFQGKDIDYSAIQSASGTSTSASEIQVNAEDTADIKFGYCTEFIIETGKEMSPEEEKEFKDYLSSIGDSIVVVADEDVVKVHVHTNDPGLALQKALTYGQLSRIKVDNMREEHQEKVIRDSEKLAKEQAMEDETAKKEAVEPETQEHKSMGFIAVSVGEGLNEIFRELGVDYIIEGGQTMNPSTEDMLKAIEQVPADNVFIFPNNKNIVLAANQAKDLTKDKNVIVIPTRTIPQGITAIINFLPDTTPQENEEVMLEQIKTVKTGQITYAIRDTRIDDREIHEGDIMGMDDDGILAVSQDVEETTRQVLNALVDDESELISLYYGQDVEEEDANRFGSEVESLYPDIDVDLHYGGQPMYYYILSVE